MAPFLWMALAACVGCRQAPPPPHAHDAAPPPPPPPSPLENVVNPWLWTTAAGATDTDKAIEDIGPYEAMPNMAGAVNTNAHYWTTNVGIAWDRDVDLDFDNEPVDLDGDGKPDTKVTRHVHAKGGVLANPELFGLTPTVADPRGHVGQISVSTGVLGLREALRPNGQRSGEIGMTCWLCHGAGDPGTQAPALGLPGARFDYGLLLATAAVLDDKNAEVVATRAARGFPPARTVRARLLLAGPGRQDLTGEFGLDVTVPFHSARYAGTRRVRQGTRGLVNPISVPGILAAPGLALENWSGSESAESPALARLVTLMRRPQADVLEAFGLGASDAAASRRAFMLDLRNLGTLGLQQDSFPGLLFADALASRVGAELTPEQAAAIPPMYATVAVRRALADGEPVTRPTVDLARVTRGRALFVERIVGEIANRQILQTAPRAFAAARLEGPMLAPIDPTKPLSAKLAVRCADCHNAAPLERTLPLAENPPPLGRCSHCHLSHPELPGVGTAAAGAEVTPDAGAADTRLVGLRTLPVPAAADAEVAYCARCHARHRAFGPIVYSGSRLFPFDANGDGDAQLHPDADARAGGIGTDPWLAFDVPRPEWPFALELPVLGADPTAPTKVTRARTGVSWVRTAPLLAISATAPYLHNGSVPTLRALFEPPSRRPVTFQLGAAGFVFDTRLPGNHSTGHDFGTKLKPSEKDDLVAFLQTL